MKTLYLINIILCAAFTSYSQDAVGSMSNYQQRSDSVLVARTFQKMESLFPMTVAEQQQVRDAVLMISRQKQETIIAFHGTDDLREKIHHLEQMQDSLFQTIIGIERNIMFKDAISAEMAAKQAEMAIKDQLYSKPPDQLNEPSFDSTAARIIAGKMKDSLFLTEDQAEQLFQVNRNHRAKQREIWSGYKNTPSLQFHMQEELQKKDSLYNVILGEEKYRLYLEKRIPLSIIN